MALVDRIQSAVIDGRAHSPRFRQRQLLQLHNALIKAESELLKAIRNDFDHSNAEAATQFYLTVTAVKDLYDSIDVKRFLEEEYSLANSKDNVARRKPVGCVAIKQTQYSPLYSTIVPAATSIAAGNCVVVELKQTLSELSQVLRRVLAAALDSDTFAIAENNVDFNKDFTRTDCVLVIPDVPEENAEVKISRSVSSPLSRAVAVVDRSTDLEKAATEIVRARFSFSGQSPYAPDVVLVNEFCMKDFSRAVVQRAASFVSGFTDVPDSSDKGSRRSLTGAKPSRDKETAGNGNTTLFSASKASIVMVHNRNSKLLGKKISEPLLLLHAVRSMDDAIDFVNSSTTPLLAAHLFAAPTAAKYLSQFVNARLSFTNHIPSELLLGPPAPVGFTPSVHPRYTPDMFSDSCPEYVSSTSQSAKLARVLDQSMVQLLGLRGMKLLVTDEPVGGAIGFFEQGIITGGTLLLATVVGSAVFAKMYALPFVLTRVGWR